ncbi:uncharacterized protein I303_100318 [Kwoniella dejecticola CBS 10117]|uniref:Uncharacterized protein n=1 Tax=Kwoniella dejecticola CBS 10117 TaxID=1296121 RepID=A0A1A6AEK4_9TREE|nr:uncharacterized protein I303_00318 [Kwoniella dejecticola CBS 10117]OBR88501.1 hypothetical protein I303_00318 [Kwoniella dejecticola CBS 10117]
MVQTAEISYPKFEVRLEVQGETTWVQGGTLASHMTTYFFDSPIRIVVVCADEGTQTNAETYRNLAVAFSLVGFAEDSGNLPTKAFNPILGVTPEE